MRNAWIISRWEFGGMISNRQFIVFTALFPLIFLGFGILSIFLVDDTFRESMSTLQGADSETLIAAIESIPGDGTKYLEVGIAVAISMIFLFVVLFSGTFVLQNIVREKQSRVVEILLSGVKPSDLIVGKILAFGGLGLVQAAVWVIVGLSALLIVGPYLGIPIWSILSVILAFTPWDMVPLFFIYFVLGYLFISSFSAAMGSTMSDVLSGQQLQSLVIALPSALPLMMLNPLISAPNGLLAKALSFIPPTIPGAMMLRLAQNQEEIPAWEVVASMLVLVLSIILIARLGSRVFEVGILLYGKTASLKEIWRWTKRP